MSDSTDKHHEALRKAISQKTTTETHYISSPFIAEGNKILMELGEELGKENEGVRHAEHLGSAAIHVYRTKTTGQYFYTTQCDSTLNKVPETVASMMSTEFQTELMRRYGRGTRKGRK